MILIDRRFSRELPIQPDYKGIQVDVYKNERALVNWDVDGVDDYAYIVKMNDDE